MHIYIYIVYIHIQKHTCIYTAHTYIRTYISTYIHTYLTRLYIHSICRFRFWIYTYLYARTHTHFCIMCSKKDPRYLHWSLWAGYSNPEAGMPPTFGRRHLAEAFLMLPGFSVRDFRVFKMQ